MANTKESTIPFRLTQAQRRAVADLFPEFADLLQLDEPNQRTLRFTLDEMKEIAGASYRSRTRDYRRR